MSSAIVKKNNTNNIVPIQETSMEETLSVSNEYSYSYKLPNGYNPRIIKRYDSIAEINTDGIVDLSDIQFETYGAEDVKYSSLTDYDGNTLYGCFFHIGEAGYEYVATHSVPIESFYSFNSEIEERLEPDSVSPETLENYKFAKWIKDDIQYVLIAENDNGAFDKIYENLKITHPDVS
jgi:hypothetical protein